MTAQMPLAPAETAPIRVAGHFGELLQGRLGPDGPLALISLPCPALAVEPGGTGDAGLIGPRRLKALCAALDLPVPEVLPPLRATMPQGGGAGSSTAALVAIARHLGYRGTPEALARACVRAEGASDPLMFPGAERLLFAPREGRVLAPLPALPRFAVLGGFHGPEVRTDPGDMAFPDIDDLVEAWRQAETLAAFAMLTSESARRTLSLRGPAGDPTEALCRDLGALGWVIAHTGNARGFLFPPGAVPPDGPARLRAAGFKQVLSFEAGGSA
jgi:hypothetical protein